MNSVLGSSMHNLCKHAQTQDFLLQSRQSTRAKRISELRLQHTGRAGQNAREVYACASGYTRQALVSSHRRLLAAHSWSCQRGHGAVGSPALA